mmetsp:Transcript_10463/g.18883  ORF Transcript_10463/g.18883 Transcript_10463/m.18883 type:complete len:290 (-) Transcript_10463:69-938(-)
MGETDTPQTKAAEDPGDVADAAVVQEVLEYLLSKKNLVRDQILASSMNPQMYIPIAVLVSHDMIQQIHASEEDIVAAASKSAKLSIDEDRTMVRPLLKSKRNVIILRDVPSETSEQDIRTIFDGEPCGQRIVSVKEEVNNTWFVKFDLDSSGTQDVVLWLRSQTFKGKPLNAAIKSEHFLRSFYPATGEATMPAPADMGPPLEEQNLEDVAAYDSVAPPGLEGLGAAWPGALPPYDMMPPPGIFAPGMSPWMQWGPQEPGYWVPWGKRKQMPPLVFSSPTTLKEEVSKA